MTTKNDAGSAQKIAPVRGRMKCSSSRVVSSLRRVALRTWLLATLSPIAASVGAAPAPTLPDVVVDAGWLHDHLASPDLIVLDARAPVDYAVDHLPGAINLPATATAARREQKEVVSSISQLRNLFSAAGVDATRTVVVYDDGDFIKAARVFWVLEVFGHAQVAVLDGGLAAWRERGLTVSTAPATPTPRTFVPTVVAARLASKIDTRLALENAAAVVVDTRSVDEYTGRAGKTDVLGHIPGAVNVPWIDNLNATSAGHAQFHDVATLAQRYQFAAGKKAVVYCNTGNLATVTYLAWRRLRWPVAMYDGSWWEWSVDASLPIERDAPVAQQALAP